jgi:hypothetical protein
MSNDIKSILDRLALVEAKISPAMPRVPGLNSQQKSVGQLPALFKPNSASPVLRSKQDPQNPLRGKLVGETALSGAEDLRAKLKALQDIQMDPNTEKDPELKKAVIQRRADLEKEANLKGLKEAMQEIEEDMLGKVKKDFVDYLERLEDRNKIDKDLVAKAKKELGLTAKADEAAVADPESFQDTEVAHDIDQTAASQAVAAEQPVKTVAMEDGAVLEIYGDEGRGFEIRRGGRSMATRFPNIDHADMAVKLFQQRRRKQDLAQDYIDEA